jgi:prephenate dehydratase
MVGGPGAPCFCVKMIQQAMHLTAEQQAKFERARVAFQGEPGAFSEAAALELLGPNVVTIPQATFDLAFFAIRDKRADALLAPIENTLAGSVLRVYDLLLESNLSIVAETVLPIEHHLIGCPGAKLEQIETVASHPMALAQCEKFFAAHPQIKRVPAEDTAGSVRAALAAGKLTAAAIAGRRAAERYGGVILEENLEDHAGNFTRFVLLLPEGRAKDFGDRTARKMSFAMRLAHRPGSLLASLEPFARYGVNLLKIESRPIHGRPWEYQFFVDVEADEPAKLEAAARAAEKATSQLRVLGLYAAAPILPAPAGDQQ